MKRYAKYGWILAISLLGYVGWYLLKIRVYDIKIPEQAAINRIWENAWVYGRGIEQASLKSKDADFLLLKWDSITWPAGVKIVPQPHAETPDYLLQFSATTLPLQIIKLWKSGYAYSKVLLYAAPIADDTSVPWEWQRELYLRVDNPEDKAGFLELYKENFDENSIFLTLEKPNPVKIIALWENYIIAGETDGKTIKITIPRCAAKFNESLIRVWACDSHTVSRCCEIPIHFGIVSNTLKRSYATLNAPEQTRLNVFKSLPQFHCLIQLNKDFDAAINQLLCKENYAPVLLHGDLRGLRLGDSTFAYISSYFGRKIVGIFNSAKTRQQLKIPLKGDLKNSIRGTIFKQKGSKLEIDMEPQSWEIIY
jgi:hypothetical protein